MIGTTQPGNLMIGTLKNVVSVRLLAVN